VGKVGAEEYAVRYLPKTKAGRAWVRETFVGPAGSNLRTLDLPPILEASRTKQTFRFLVPLLGGLPLGAAAIRTRFQVTWRVRIPSGWIDWICAALGGIFAGGKVSWLGRRTGLGRREHLASSAAAFLLGPPALLAALAILDRPPVERCLACPGLRPVAADGCPSCGALAPSPKRDGTEIVDFEEPPRT